MSIGQFIAGPVLSLNVFLLLFFSFDINSLYQINVTLYVHSVNQFILARSKHDAAECMNMAVYLRKSSVPRFVPFSSFQFNTRVKQILRQSIMYELFTLVVSNSHGYRQQSHYPCSIPLGFPRLVPASDIYVRALGKLAGYHSTEYVTLAFPF